MDLPHQTLGSLGPILLPSLGGGPTLYVTGEERLRLRSFCGLAGVTLTLETRLLRLDGSIQVQTERQVCGSARAEETVNFPIGEGWLQHVNVRATVGSPRGGQVYVVVDLVRGQTGNLTPIGVLVQGYATASEGLAWPGGGMRSMTDGRGVIRSITGTDPAAGVEISETVPTNARWHLLGITASLVTSATVANREAAIVTTDGAAVIARVTAAQAQAASLTRDYSFLHEIQRGVSAVGQIINVPMPHGALMGGFVISTVTTNLQAGDNWGAPQLWVEEWIED